MPGARENKENNMSPQKTKDDDDRDLTQDGENTTDDNDSTDDSGDDAANLPNDDDLYAEDDDENMDEDDDATLDDVEADDDQDDEDWEDEDEDPLSFLDDDDYEITDLDSDEEDVEDAEDIEDSAGEDSDITKEDPKQVRKLRNENAGWRTKYRSLQEQSIGLVEEGVNDYAVQLAETLGIQPEDGFTPEAVTTAVAERMAALLEGENTARRDLAIHRAAAPVGADMDKLSDSKTFTNALQNLDPRSETFDADVAKAVSVALEANPHFKAAEQLDRVGGDFTGGTNASLPEDSVESFAQKRRQRRGVQL